MLDVVVLFFLFGLLAGLVRSELKLPPALYDTLSLFLLLAIGLKGGVEIARSESATLWVDALLAIGLGAIIPLLVFPLFRLRFSRPDAASLSAHYGSVSIVTFAVGAAVLAGRGVEVEGHLALLAALMEAPALIVATLIARWGVKSADGSSTAGALVHEVFANKSVVLLGGGILIGWVAGPQGLEPLSPLFVDLFKGALCLFLLEMGLIAADRLPDLKKAGLFLVGSALALPPVLALAGWGVAQLMGLGVGGTVLMMTLAGSASYIAAPTAMRIAVPEANPALGVAAALAVTFPFNLLLGIPLYLWWAQTMAGA